MKTFVNKISESQRIYKSQASDSTFKTWPLKKTKCRIYLYEDVSCSDIDTIICSTLYLHDGVLSVDDLAVYENIQLHKNHCSNYSTEDNTYRKLAGYMLNERYISNETYNRMI